MNDCPCGGTKCRLDLDDPRHGSANGYSNLGCRCDGCRTAHAEYFRDGRGGVGMTKYRQRLVDAGLTQNGVPRKSYCADCGSKRIIQEHSR